MELWRLRAREFLSARSTHDSCEDESLDEALSSPNSAPMNWGHGHGDRGETTLSERGWGTGQTTHMSSLLSLSPVLPPAELWVWQPGWDQVWHLSTRQRSHRCGVPPSAPCGRTRAWQQGREGEMRWWRGGKKKTKSCCCCWCFETFLSNPEVKAETGALR